MNSWVQFALAGWARKQADDRLATLWKQLTVARSHYKPGVDSLDSANALAVRLEAVRTEIERRGGLPQETFEPSPWYKGVDERASWTLTDFTILPPDTEFSVQSQSLALPWPPLDTTSGTTLPGSASKPDDILGAFLNLDDATIQGIKEIADASEPNLFLDPIDDITQTDPYQAYRVSDNDLSDLFSSGQQFAFEAPTIDGVNLFTQTQPMFGANYVPTVNSSTNDATYENRASTKRKIDRLDNGMPGPSRTLCTTTDVTQAEHDEIPTPKRPKTAGTPRTPVQTTGFDNSIQRILDKKKKKWLVEYVADTKTGRVLKQKWLSYSQGKHIPKSVQDEYHKRAWQKIADKVKDKIDQDEEDR
ncbi:hypothetical protein OHC33_007236 [Knufia fluminis]|uniref:Uncharacterized protein n=1 Tax=Knufia fluminis TaxID=191047 RepID=A0AAN8EBZ5_9EURO|nr:hypothetical protein OHC33_007236 [Knufia fluminis]